MSGRYRRARRSPTCRRIGPAPTARRRRTSFWCWPMTSVNGDAALRPDPSPRLVAFVSPGARAHAGSRVRQSRARRRGGCLRALAGALARRAGHALVHEPDPGTARRRRMDIAQARGKAELPVPRRCHSISSARTTTSPASIQMCSLFSPLLHFDDQETARLVAGLAREALFDAANAEAADMPVGNLLRRRASPPPRSLARSPSWKRNSLLRNPSATSCASGGRGTTVAIEGELIVRLRCEARRVRQVTVRSTRPTIAARVLSGKAPADAAAAVRRLFSICGGAQGAAAAAALTAAGATGDDARVRRPRPRSDARSVAGHVLAPADRLAEHDGNGAVRNTGRRRALPDRVVDARDRRHAAAARRGGDARAWRAPVRRSRRNRSSACRPPPGSNRKASRRCVAWCARGATVPATLLRPCAGRVAHAGPQARRR